MSEIPGSIPSPRPEPLQSLLKMASFVATPPSRTVNRVQEGCWLLNAHRVGGQGAVGEARGLCPGHSRRVAVLAGRDGRDGVDGVVLRRGADGGAQRVPDHVERGAAGHGALQGRLDADGRRVPHVAGRVLAVLARVLAARVPPRDAPLPHPRPRQRPRLGLQHNKHDIKHNKELATLLQVEIPH